MKDYEEINYGFKEDPVGFCQNCGQELYVGDVYYPDLVVCSKCLEKYEQIIQYDSNDFKE